MAASIWRCGSCVRRKVVLWISCPANLGCRNTARCYASTSEFSESEEVLPVPSRKMKSIEGSASLKYSLGTLKKRVSIDTKKAYKPPDDARDRVRQILETTVDSVTLQPEWESTSLSNPKTKYALLTKLMHEFNHDIPGVIMSDMTSVGDAVQYFETAVRATSAYEDLASRRDLPTNLSIQLEPLRFDPETDTMFGGRTAFPGRDTIVLGIKNRRKYSDTKTRKEKPGYVNHYYEY